MGFLAHAVSPQRKDSLTRARKTVAKPRVSGGKLLDPPVRSEASGRPAPVLLPLRRRRRLVLPRVARAASARIRAVRRPAAGARGPAAGAPVPEPFRAGRCRGGGAGAAPRPPLRLLRSQHGRAGRVRGRAPAALALRVRPTRAPGSGPRPADRAPPGCGVRRRDPPPLRRHPRPGPRAPGAARAPAPRPARRHRGAGDVRVPAGRAAGLPADGVRRRRRRNDARGPGRVAGRDAGGVRARDVPGWALLRAGCAAAGGRARGRDAARCARCQRGRVERRMMRGAGSGRVAEYDEARNRLRAALAERLRLDPDVIDPAEPFERYGLDSVGAAALVAELSDWLGCPMSPVVVWESPTVDALAAHLSGRAAPTVGRAAGAASTADEPIAVVGLACRFPGAPDPAAYWRLLCEGRGAIG